MRLFFIFGLVFQLFGHSGNAQNLIPNHSFERVFVVDSFFNSSCHEFNRKIANWSSPTQTSPDIIHEDHIEKMYAAGRNIPRSNFYVKPLKPKSGNTFVGIKVFGCVLSNTHCREYLQVKILERMKKDDCYEYSFYTSPLTNGSRVNNLGVAFSDSLINELEVYEVLQLNNKFGEKDIISPGPGKWQQIKGQLTARSDWKYMIVGNFFHDSETLERSIDNGYEFGYYLVDDVSLIKIDCESGNPIFENSNSIIYFESNQSTLDANQQQEIDSIVVRISMDELISIQINGHADEEGNELYNDQLSMKRAREVLQYFRKSSIPEDKLIIQALGEKVPISDSDYNRNRRVEIKLIY